MADIKDKSNLLEVSNPSEGVVVVYPKPNEEVVIDMELGSLERKIVGRDLVITTYSGGSIVVANYVVLFAQNNGLVVKDSTGVAYGIEDMLEEGSRAGFTGEELPKIIIDRELSSAGVSDTGEKYLQSSSSKLLEDVFSKDLLVGSVDIDTQNPVAELNPNLDPYEIRSLFLNNDKKFDTDVVYRFNGSTFFNQNQSYFKPVKVGSGSVDIVALYGTKTEDNTGKVINFGKTSELVYNGGGLIDGRTEVDIERNLVGADYMWSAQEINLADREGGVFVNLLNKELFSDTFADSSDEWKSVISRKISFNLNGSNVRIVDMFLTGLPEGVKIVESEGAEVFSGGGGALIRPKGTSSSLVVELEYAEGFNMGEIIDANMVMSLNGYNSRTKTLIQVDNTFKLQFREVKDGGDLINFSEVDAYTFSTALDPKKIITGEGNDFVVSGHGSNEYELGAGDDIFVSGKGLSLVDMSSGDDVYYAGLSGDIVDGGSGNNTIRIKGDLIDGVGATSFKELGVVDVFNNVLGKVLFLAGSGVPVKSEVKLEFEGGAGSSLKNFSNLYLSNKVNNIEVESTFNLNESSAFNLYANEVLGSGGVSAKVVNFSGSLSRAYINMNEGYFSTNSDVGVTGTGSKVNFWHANEVAPNGDVLVNEIHKFVGSKGYVDEVVGSSNREVVVDKEAGSVGNYVLDYSLISSGIKVYYDPVKGYVNVDRNSDRLYKDEYEFITSAGSKFLGTDYVDEYAVSNIFGALDIDDVSRTGDIVDYIALTNGVEVDFTNDDEVNVVRYNSIGKVVDSLKGFNRENVHLTANNDIVKDNKLSNGIDGLGGNNKLDLSEVVGSLTLSLSEYNKSVFNVTGLAERYDYNNFNEIVMGNGADTILFAGVNGMKVDAGGLVNNLEVVTTGVHATDYVKNIEIGSGANGYDKVYVVTDAGGTATEVVSEFKGVSSYTLTDNNDRISINSPQDLNGKTIDAKDSTFTKGTLSYVYDAAAASGNVLTDGDTLNITSGVVSSGLDLFGSGAFERITGFNSIVFDNGKFSGNLKINMNVKTEDVDSTNLSFRHVYGAKLVELGGGSRGYRNNNEINNNTAGANAFLNTVYEINGINTTITYGGIAGQDFYFRNFNKIVGAATADIFNVTASNIDLDINGGSGANELDYSASVGNLYVSFIAGDVSIYKDASNVDYLTKNYDKYTGALAKITGGAGDDYFALDTLNATFEIDGGTGTNNFVSFANVVGNFTLANVIDDSNYTNIQGFELTNNDDIFGVDIAQDFFYDGGRGLDQILFRNVTGALTYEINDSKDASGNALYTTATDAGTGTTRNIKNFETFIGVNDVNTTFNINTYTNRNDIGAYNQYFYLGGRSTGVDITNTVSYNYTSSTEGLSMFIGVDPYRYENLGEEGGSGGDYEFLTKVVKGKDGSGNEAVDWFSRVSSYTLSDFGDTVRVNVASLVGVDASADISSIEEVDMGAGLDTVDFSVSTIAINIDFSNNSINGGATDTWNFTNWESLILTEENDTVELSSEILQASFDNDAAGNDFYTINGAGGVNELSFNALTGTGFFGGTENVGVAVDVSDLTKGVEVFVNDATKQKLLNVTNFSRFVGSSFNDLFWGSAQGSTDYTKSGGVGTIDYSKATVEGFRGFTFDINTGASSRITKNEISRFVDTVDENFTKFVGTNKSDTFVINSITAGTQIDIDAKGGVNSLLLGAAITSTLTEGLVLDLNKGNLYRKGSTTTVDYNNGNGAGGSFETQIGGASVGDTDAIAKVKGIRVVGGTSEDDIYIANQDLFASSGGVIDGEGGSDQLYLQSDIGDGYLLDASKSIIRYQGATGAIKPEVSVKNIEEIFFGKGDDSVIIGSGSSVTAVDGGTGNNKIDLSNLLVAVTGDINSLSIGGGSISLKDFINYALTNYNDKIQIQGNSIRRVLDGNKGINEVEYLTNASATAIELNLGSNYKGTIERTVSGAAVEDDLTNFSVYKVNSFTNTTVNVTSNKSAYDVELSNADALIIDYSDLKSDDTSAFTASVYADFGRGLNIFKYEGNNVSGSDIYTGISGVALNNNSFTFKGSVGNDQYNLGEYTSVGVRQIEVFGDVATSSKTIYASDLATGGNGVVYDFTNSIRVSGNSGASYNIVAGTGSSIATVGLIGGSRNADEFNFAAGSLANIRDGLTIDGVGGADSLDFSAEASIAGDTMKVDFINNQIAFSGSNDKTIKLQNAIYNISSYTGAGSVEFSGLNDIREYTVDATGVTGNTKVSYNGAGGAINIDVDAGGNVVVNKGTRRDTLTNIKEYGATNFNDRITIDIASLATLDASFDGGAGSDTLDLAYNGADALTVRLDAAIDGVVWRDNTGNLNVKNVESLEVSGANTGAERATLEVSNVIGKSVITTFKAGDAGDNQSAVYNYSNASADSTVINVLLDGGTLSTNYTTALAAVSSGGNIISTTLLGVVDYNFSTGVLDKLNVRITDFDLDNYNTEYGFNAGNVNGENHTLSLTGVLNVDEITFTGGATNRLSFSNGTTTRSFDNFNNLEFTANYAGITNFTVGDYTRLTLDLAGVTRANKITLNTGALIVANGLVGANRITYNNGSLNYVASAGNTVEVALASAAGSSNLTASSEFLNITTAGATYAVIGNSPVNDMPRFVALNTGGSNVDFSGYTGTSNLFTISNVVADMALHNAIYGAGTGNYDNNSRTNYTMQDGTITIAGANNYVFSGGNDRVVFNNSSTNSGGGYVAASITLDGGAGIDTLVLEPNSNADLGLLSPNNNTDVYNGGINNGADTTMPKATSSVVITQDGIWKSAKHTAIYKLGSGLNGTGYEINNNNPSPSHRVDFNYRNFEKLDLSAYDNLMPLGKQIAVTVGDNTVTNTAFLSNNYWQEIIMPNRNPYLTGETYLTKTYTGTDRNQVYAATVTGYDDDDFLPANHVFFNAGSIDNLNLTASFSFKANGNADYGYNLDGSYTTNAGVRTSFSAKHVTNFNVGIDTSNIPTALRVQFAATTAAQTLSAVASFNNGSLLYYNTGLGGGILNSLPFYAELGLSGGSSGRKIASLDLSGLTIPKVGNYTYSGGTLVAPTSTDTLAHRWIVDAFFDQSRLNLAALGENSYQAFRQGFFNQFLSVDIESTQKIVMPKGVIYLGLERMFSEYGTAYITGLSNGLTVDGIDNDNHNDKLILSTDAMIDSANNNKFAASGLDAWSKGNLTDKQYHVLFEDGTGRSNYETTGNKFTTFNNLSVILMASGEQDPGNNISGRHYITIGNKYNHATNSVEAKQQGEVYESNKVYIVAGINTRFFRDGGVNHYQQVYNKGSGKDVADFSGIKSGDYAFMPTYAPKAMFNTPWQRAAELAAVKDVNNARHNPLMSTRETILETFDRARHGGQQNLENIIAFGYKGTAKEMNFLSEHGHGTSPNTPLFYRLSGVEFLRLTDANNTYYTGNTISVQESVRTAGSYNPSYYSPVSGLKDGDRGQNRPLLTNLATILGNELHAGEGKNDTLVINTFTASNKIRYEGIADRPNGWVTMDVANYLRIDTTGIVSIGKAKYGTNGAEQNWDFFTNTYGFENFKKENFVVDGDNTTFNTMQLNGLRFGGAFASAPVYQTGTKGSSEIYMSANRTNDDIVTVNLGGRWFRDADKEGVALGIVADGGVSADGMSLGIVDASGANTLSNIIATSSAFNQNYNTNALMFPNTVTVQTNGIANCRINMTISMQNSTDSSVDTEYTVVTQTSSTSGATFAYTQQYLLQNIDAIAIFNNTGHKANVNFNLNINFSKLSGKFLSLNNFSAGVEIFTYDNYNYISTLGAAPNLFVLTSKLDSADRFYIYSTSPITETVNGITNGGGIPVSRNAVLKDFVETLLQVQQTYTALDDFYNVMGMDNEYKDASAFSVYKYAELDDLYAKETEDSENTVTSDDVLDVVAQAETEEADAETEANTEDGAENGTEDVVDEASAEDVVIVEEPVDVGLANVKAEDVKADAEVEAEGVAEETNAEDSADADENDADAVEDTNVTLSDDMDALLGDMLGFEANSSTDNSFSLDGLNTSNANASDSNIDEDFSNTMNELSQLEASTAEQQEHESIAFALDSSVDIADDGSTNQTEQAKVKNTVGVGE